MLPLLQLNPAGGWVRMQKPWPASRLATHLAQPCLALGMASQLTGERSWMEKASCWGWMYRSSAETGCGSGGAAPPNRPSLGVSYLSQWSQTPSPRPSCVGYGCRVCWCWWPQHTPGGVEGVTHQRPGPEGPWPRRGFRPWTPHGRPRSGPCSAAGSS